MQQTPSIPKNLLELSNAISYTNMMLKKGNRKELFKDQILKRIKALEKIFIV